MSSADDGTARPAPADHPGRAPRARPGRAVAAVLAVAASAVALAPTMSPATRATAARALPPSARPACVASAPRLAPDAEAGAARAARLRAALAPCMAAMHAEMHAALAAPNDDADALFARAMIPHHQGAVDMARQLLVHGRDPELRAFALGVIAEQQAEVEMLRAWVARRPPTHDSPERSAP